MTAYATLTQIRIRLGLVTTTNQNDWSGATVKVDGRYAGITEIRRNGTPLGAVWTFRPPNTVIFDGGSEATVTDYHEVDAYRGPSDSILNESINAAHQDLLTILKRSAITLSGAQETEIAPYEADLAAAIHKENYLESASNDHVRGVTDNDRHSVKWRKRAIDAIESYLAVNFSSAYVPPGSMKRGKPRVSVHGLDSPGDWLP